jgi:hypothetical protein
MSGAGFRISAIPLLLSAQAGTPRGGEREPCAENRAYEDITQESVSQVPSAVYPIYLFHLQRKRLQPGQGKPGGSPGDGGLLEALGESIWQCPCPEMGCTANV